jgi:hypothetical protein
VGQANGLFHIQPHRPLKNSSPTLEFLLPVIAIQAAVLHGLGEVLGGDAFGVVEIRDGARDCENPVVRAGGKAEAAHGHFERALAGIVQGAQPAEGLRRNVRVVISALLLQGAGGADALPNLGGRHAVIPPP